MKTYANRTDEELALLYTAGDNKAFDELLARNQQKLFNYILFVVRDQDIANDIFQDTFIKAITKLQEGKYADSGKFSFWLTRIAHNVIIDKFRRTKSEHIIEPNVDNDLSHLSNDTLTEGNTSCNPKRSGIYALLSRAILQGDRRTHRSEHQHLFGTDALCPHQHAAHGKTASNVS